MIPSRSPSGVARWLTKNVLGKGSRGLDRLPWPAAWGRREPSGHESDHGPPDHGLGVLRQTLVVAVQAPAAHQTGQGALDHPPAGQDRDYERLPEHAEA